MGDALGDALGDERPLAILSRQSLVNLSRVCPFGQRRDFFSRQCLVTLSRIFPSSHGTNFPDLRERALREAFGEAFLREAFGEAFGEALALFGTWHRSVP